MSSHTRFRAPAVVLTALFTLLIGLLGIAPAQAVPATSAPTTWQVLVGNQSPDEAIQGMRFLPDDITINSGDSINFVANAGEIHTVSYGTPPLPPTLQNLIAIAGTPVGGPVFNPSLPWTNSGLLAQGGGLASYQLEFVTTGDFTFYCIIHGHMMSATVHVQAKGTAYPHSQQYYTAQGLASGARILAHGYQLWRATLAQSSPTHVFAGAMNDEVMVMRFIPSLDVVRAGTTVTFDMGANAGLVPHTVTFTDLKKTDGTPVDSGILLPAGVPSPFPSSFTWTFDQVGTWNYFCEFHDDLGMVGSVIVTP